MCYSRFANEPLGIARHGHALAYHRSRRLAGPKSRHPTRFRTLLSDPLGMFDTTFPRIRSETQEQESCRPDGRPDR